MLNPTTTITSSVREPVANPLTAFGEDRTPAGLFTVPIDVALLEELQLDEARSALAVAARRLPALAHRRP